MKRYSVFELNDSKYNILVIANTYENPVNELLYEGNVSFIEDGDIIFDLAIINGLKANRFVKAEVKSHQIIPDTIKVVSDVCSKVKEISKNYFENNNEIVRRSVLPKATKYLLSKNSI